MMNARADRIAVVLPVVALASVLLVSVPEPVQAGAPAVPRNLRNALRSHPDPDAVWQSIQELQYDIRDNPAEYINYELLALAYDNVDCPAEAARAIETAVALYPRGMPGRDALYGNLAREYLLLGESARAKAAIDRAIRLNPDNPVSHSLLVDYYLLQGDDTSASPALKAYAALVPDRDVYYAAYVFALGHGYTSAQTERFLRRAVRDNPRNHFAQRALAVALRNGSADIGRDYQRIIRRLHLARKLCPDYIYTYISIADTYLVAAAETGNRSFLREALSWLDVAAGLNPQHVKLTQSRGLIYLYLRDYESAVRDLSYARIYDPDSSGLRQALARALQLYARQVYVSDADASRAQALIARSLSVCPDNASAWAMQAELFLELGRRAEAEQSLRRAVTLDPENRAFRKLGRRLETEVHPAH